MTIRPLPTLDDIKRLARELSVTFADNRDSFDLDKSEPLEVHGTYRNNQAGYNAAFSVLVRLQESQRKAATHATAPEPTIDEPMSKGQLIRTTIGFFLLSGLFTGLLFYGVHHDPTSSTYVYFFGLPMTWLLAIVLSVYNVRRYRSSHTAENGLADTAWMVALCQASCIENWEAGAMMVRGSGVIYVSVGEQEIGSFPETDTDAISAALQRAGVSPVGWKSIQESLAQGNTFPKWSEYAHLNRHRSDGQLVPPAENKEGNEQD